MNSIQWMAKQVFAPLPKKLEVETVDAFDPKTSTVRKYRRKAFPAELVEAVRVRLEDEGKSKIAVMKALSIGNNVLDRLIQENNIKPTFRQPKE